MTILRNLVQQRLLCSLHVGQEGLLEVGDLGGVQFVEEPSDSAVDYGNLKIFSQSINAAFYRNEIRTGLQWYLFG